MMDVNASRRATRPLGVKPAAHCQQTGSECREPG
jgi:hypothetical protein